MRHKLIYFLILINVAISGCFNDKKSDSPKKKDSNSESFTKYEAGIKGFSGICTGKTKDIFLAVSDKRGIFEISKDGKTIRKLPFPGSYDFEGITINPATNEIYLADEAQMKVFKLSADDTSIELITDINIPKGVVNKGIEGITFGNDTLYIVNQESPAILIKYDLKANKEFDRLTLNYVKSLSDISYDTFDRTLWILDSKEQRIFHTDLNGTVIASQAISYIEKAEAIFVDSAAKIAWIGCDETGFLYKVKLEI